MPFMVAIMPYLAAAGAAIGAISESNQQQTAMKLSAQSDEMNALALKQQAGTVNEQANLEEETQRKQARQVAGEQRAAMAQAGTGLLSSTNQNLAVQSAKAAEQDALNIRYGGLLEAHGLMANSAQSAWQAKATRSQIKGVRASGYLRAGTAALSAYSGNGGRFGSYGSAKVSTGTAGYTGTGPP
jgi:hypothetical protein